MSEHKKVEFSTVGSTKEVKKSNIKCRTIRLLVTLPESNEKSCPEFNYGDLLSQHLRDRLGKKTMGEVINGPSLDPKDPFATDEDEALRVLARKFEKKYGLGEAGKPRKRKRENTDFKKLGEGYDETDPFIDNSDAVDDVVPTNMETKHRGFYINSGELDFEEVQLSEEEDDAASVDSVVQTKKKKRVPSELSSGDEEPESAIEEKEEPANNVKNKVRENGIIVAKKRDLDEGELLRKRKRMIDKFNAKKLKTGKVESDTEAKSPIPEVKEADEPKPIEKSIAASIEAVVNKARQLAVNDLPEEPEEAENKKEEKESSSSSAGSSSSSSSSSSDSSSSESESEDEKESENEEEKKQEMEEVATSQDLENGVLSPSETDREVCLPRDLPKDLIDIIDQLKEYGINNKEASSQKFFTEPVKKLLLSIEIKLCKFGGRKKTLIYNHLSQHLPCGTQTLVKRGKTSLLEFLENRMEGPFKRLKEAVNAVMPALVASHAGECQKIVEQKGEGQAQPEKESGDTTQKKIKLPKKKFTFTNDIREALCEVVKVRCKGWSMIKKRSETPEVHITKFLDSEVKAIWPKGWITTKVLYKESEAAHSHITSKEINKAPVAAVIPQKKMTVLGGGIVNNNNNNDIQAITKNSEENGPKEIILKDKLQLEKPVTNEPKESKEVTPPKHSNIVLETKISSDVSKIEVKDKSNISEVEIKVKKDENITKSQISSLPVTKSLPNDVSNKDVTIKKPRNPQGGMQVPSPISDSSSFLGFESPIRGHCHTNTQVPGAGKLSSVISTTKKVFDSDAGPHVREGKPPKPSLTATALPKIATSINTMPIATVEVTKKNTEEKAHDAQLLKSKDEQAVKCISIKSVDKINETFKGNLPIKKDFNKESVNTVDAGVKDKRTLSTESSKSGDSVSVIDVSSDDEKRKSSDKCNLNKSESNISVSSLDLSLRSEKESDKDSPNKNCNISGSGDSLVKDNKLEQEMDQVMLELLQISKQKKSNEEKTKDQHHMLTNLRDVVSKPVISKSETIPDQSQKLPQNPLPPRSVEPMLSPTQSKVPTMKSPNSGFSSTPIISKKAHLLADPNANYTPTIDTSLQRKSPTTSISQISPRSSNPVDLITSHSDSSKSSATIQIHSSLMNKPSTGPALFRDNNPNSLIKNPSDASSRYCKDEMKAKGLPSSLSITTSSSSNSGVNYTTAKTVNVVQLQRNIMSPPTSTRIIPSSQHLSSQREFSGSHKVDIITAGSNSDSGQSMSIDLTVPFKKDNSIPKGRDHPSYQMIENSIKSINRYEHQTPSQRYRHDQLSPHKENTTSRNYQKPPQREQTSLQGGNYYSHGGNVDQQSRLSSPGNQSSGSRSTTSPQHGSGSSASPSRGQKSPQLGPTNTSQRGSSYLQGSHRPSQSGKIISSSSSNSSYSTSLGLVPSNSDRLSQSSVRSPQIGHHGMSQNKSPVSSHSLTASSYNSSSKSHPSDRGSPRSSSSSSTSHSSAKVPSHNIDGLLYNSPYASVPRVPSTTNQQNQNRYPVSSQLSSQLSSSQKHEKLHSSSPAVPTWTNDPTRRSKPSSTKHKSSDNYPTGSGNGGDPLANLRLMQGLSVTKKPQSISFPLNYSSTQSSEATRLLTSHSGHESSSSLSAQPKLKHRNEHYPSSHSLMANLTTEQQVELIKQQSNSQQDFWQQMNAGGFLPGMPPNESYKYRSPTGSYQGANNSSGGSSKKNQQY